MHIHRGLKTNKEPQGGQRLYPGLYKPPEVNLQVSSYQCLCFLATVSDKSKKTGVLNVQRAQKRSKQRLMNEDGRRNRTRAHVLQQGERKEWQKRRGVEGEMCHLDDPWVTQQLSALHTHAHLYSFLAQGWEKSFYWLIKSQKQSVKNCNKYKKLPALL